MAAGEFRTDQVELLVDAEIVVAVGMFDQHAAAFGRVLGDVGVDPAVRMLVLETLTRLEQFRRGTEGEAWRDGVEVAALVVILAISRLLSR